MLQQLYLARKWPVMRWILFGNFGGCLLQIERIANRIELTREKSALQTSLNQSRTMFVTHKSLYFFSCCSVSVSVSTLHSNCCRFINSLLYFQTTQQLLQVAQQEPPLKAAHPYSLVSIKMGAKSIDRWSKKCRVFINKSQRSTTSTSNFTSSSFPSFSLLSFFLPFSLTTKRLRLRLKLKLAKLLKWSLSKAGHKLKVVQLPVE